MKRFTINIHPDHLLYTIVRMHPQLQQLTTLDALVLAGLLLSGSQTGIIRLSTTERTRLEKELQLSKPGFSNSIKRLISLDVLQKTNGRYHLNPNIVYPLAVLPKRLEDHITIKLVTNKQ